MKKRSLIMSVILGLVAVGLMSSQLMAIEGLDAATEEALYDLQATMYPPKVWSIALDPEAPGAGEAVMVSAEIYNDTDLTDDETMTAWLLYSVDSGESWEEVEMDTDDDMTWTAEIAGQDSGTEVWWMLRADDTSTNVYFETPCYVDDITEDGKWPIDDICLQTGASDEDPVDDAEVNAEDDLDLLELKYGESEDYVYVQMKVQGQITDGSASPTYIHGYAGALVNPDRGTDLLDAGLIFVYAPLAKLANFDTCLTVIQKAGEADYGKKGIECHREGEYLMFQLEKDYIGDNPSNFFKFAGITAAVTSIQPFAGAPKDWTHVTSMARIQRYFTVE